MELQTIRQVTQNLGVSRRMLCYYEEVGLISSTRREDYAYRIYDEDAIRRLQQIVILRKLQIPVRQIKAIFDSPDAVEVIKVFEQNIAEMDEQITALSTVKSILAQFVAQLQEKADVQLKLDLLNDTSMIAVVNSLSFSDNKIKENVKMEDLNKAGDVLKQAKLDQVRIVYHPTETIAMLEDVDEPPSQESKDIMAKFIRDTNLFKIKPDFRCGFNWGFYVTIPDDLDVPAPFKKQTFEGGLWAVYKITPENFDEFDMVSDWVKSRNDYLRDYQRPRHDVYFNPLNIYGMKNTDLFDDFHDQYKEACEPIKEIEILTSEELNRLNTLLKKTEDLIDQRIPTVIDLSNIGKAGELEPIYNNGILELVSNGEMNGLRTLQEFKLPLKIDLCVKTDNKAIVIKYAHGTIDIGNTNVGINFWPLEGGKWRVYENCGELPESEFYNFEFIFGKDICAIKINGKLYYLRDDDDYVKSFAENSEYYMSSTFAICTWGSYVGVKSLQITEI